MSTFVLVHGSWHGAWCWEKTTPLLERAGHRVIALDLPGHGLDQTPLSRVSLDAYAESICEATAGADVDPVVVVGHSMGGAAITQAAAMCPGTIDVLVYLAAFVPGHGTSVFEQASADVGSLLPSTVELDDRNGVVLLDNARVVDCFYADCSAEDVSFACKRLRDDPLAPLMTPLSLDGAPPREVPRIYIECLQDAALTVDHQRAIRSGVAWDEVFSLDTGHSPFFSAPEQLADHLMASVAFAR